MSGPTWADIAVAVIAGAAFLYSLWSGLRGVGRLQRVERLTALIKQIPKGDPRRHLIRMRADLIDEIWERHRDRAMLRLGRIGWVFIVPAFALAAWNLLNPAAFDGWLLDIALLLTVPAVLIQSVVFSRMIRENHPAVQLRPWVIKRLRRSNAEQAAPPSEPPS